MTQTSVLPTAADTPVTRPAPRKRARRVRRLSGRDRWVLALMVGVPTLIQAVLIWIPTLLSIGLSFTKWNGLALDDIKPVGWGNYRFAVEDYPPFWPAIWHNVIWLV